IGWVQRDALRAWFCVRGLVRASERERERWLVRVAALGEPAVLGLVEALAAPDPAQAVNAEAGLAPPARPLGPPAPRPPGPRRPPPGGAGPPDGPLPALPAPRRPAPGAGRGRPVVGRRDCPRWPACCHGPPAR